MTTHDRITETTPSPQAPRDAAGTTEAATQPTTARTESAVPTAAQPTEATETHDVSTDQPESVSGRTLFADDERTGLRSRWDNVQAAFVDDPKECVHKADGLVADVVDQLTAGFAETRSRLEEQWARGHEASTEDLRQALRHYRDFFERLLAV
jgi:hypothetical protein